MSSREDAGPTGTIYDIQGFSVQDGPGIRTTVFLKGCPLHCPWCHSPESQRFDVQLSWQSRKCIGTKECGLCLTVCPRGALRPAPVPEGASNGTEGADGTDAQGRAALVPGGAVPGGDGVLAAECPVAPVDAGVRLMEVDWDRCDDCGLCAEHCPAGALSMWGKSYTVPEVVTRVLRDRPFFEKSGGGVTISGGEPFSQPKFTLALLQALKREGLHTALDTTGFASWGVLERALPFVDLFLLDLKHMGSAAHKAAVGVHNERILDNARHLAAAGARMQIRVPVIPRFNGSGGDMRALGAFVAGLGDAVTLVQLLPYHAMGVPKWERIKHDGPILEAVAPSDQRMAELRAILEEYDLPVQVH